LHALPAAAQPPVAQVPPLHESPEQQCASLAQALPLVAQLAPLELDPELALEEVLLLVELPPGPEPEPVGPEPAAHPRVEVKRRTQGSMDSSFIGVPFAGKSTQQRRTRRSSRHRAQPQHGGPVQGRLGG
jgi:hypothetical protein